MRPLVGRAEKEGSGEPVGPRASATADGNKIGRAHRTISTTTGGGSSSTAASEQTLSTRNQGSFVNLQSRESMIFHLKEAETDEHRSKRSRESKQGRNEEDSKSESHTSSTSARPEKKARNIKSNSRAVADTSFSEGDGDGDGDDNKKKEDDTVDEMSSQQMNENLSRSERKLLRERQRRSDLHRSFQNLIEKLSAINPEMSRRPTTDDSSERAAVTRRGGRENIAEHLENLIQQGGNKEQAAVLEFALDGGKLNRVEVIDCAAETLERLLVEREEAKAKIDEISRQLRDQDQQIAELKTQLHQTSLETNRNEPSGQPNIGMVATTAGSNALLGSPLVASPTIFTPLILSANTGSAPILGNVAGLLQSNAVASSAPLQGMVPVMLAPSNSVSSGAATNNQAQVLYGSQTVVPSQQVAMLNMSTHPTTIGAPHVPNVVLGQIGHGAQRPAEIGQPAITSASAVRSTNQVRPTQATSYSSRNVGPQSNVFSPP